ncbi:uncharacterized protein [Rutidosis leptorrhynchoides]|uniref:uncharacterized protein n=1 Tax=Rutidosis leptorrhynchoides TaxID=125765 RepID=UPI003A9905EF
MKFGNLDMTWTSFKKGRRSTTTRRRMPWGSSFKIHDSVVYEHEKSGVAILGQHFAEEVADVPIKKRLCMLQPQTPPIDGSAVVRKCSPNDDFSGIELLAAAACHSSIYDSSESTEVVHTITKVSVQTDEVKEDIVPVISDESSVQASTIAVMPNICDNGNREGDKSPVVSKGVRLHWDLNTVPDEWEEPCDLLADPHTEKDDGFHNGQTKLEVYETINSQIAEDFKGNVAISIHGNNDGAITCKTSDSESCMSKSDGVNFVNPVKSENVSTSTASIINFEFFNKSEDGQAVSEVVQGGCVSIKGDGNNDKVNSEDRLSDCCGSNVSHDERVEGDTIDTVKAVGYDSPVEDGELREPSREYVDYESDNMYEDNFDTLESVRTEIPLNHNQTIGVLGADMISESQPDNKADALGSKELEHRLQEHSMYATSVKKYNGSERFRSVPRSGGNMFGIDRSTSTSFDVHKNGDCIRRSRSDNVGDTYLRAERDFGPKRFMGRDRTSYNGRTPNDASGRWGGPVSRNGHGYPGIKNAIAGSSNHDNNQGLSYNPRGNFRTFDRRPSPSDRNEAYRGGVHRAPLPARGGISRVRSTGEFKEYYDSEVGYGQRKPYSSNFDRGAYQSQTRRRSRSRSRSGSPVAWHFPKKRIVVAEKRQSPDYRPDTRFPLRKPGEKEAFGNFNNRNVVNGQYNRDRRSSPVRTFTRNEKFDSPSYVKSDDNLRRIPRPGRYSQANTNDSVLHDEKYGMMNERRRYRSDVDESFKGWYPRNKDNGFGYGRSENTCFIKHENTSEEKGCRYAANKMFNAGEGEFRKDNLQRE